MTSDSPEETGCSGTDDATVTIKVNGIRVKAKGKSALYIITLCTIFGWSYLQL
jgi:hypothetical protein